MVKKIAVLAVAILFFVGTTPIFAADAADEGKSGPNPSKEAYEHASEHAKFKRTADVTDKEAVKAAKKAEKEAEKAKKETDKEKQKVEKEAKKKQKEMEKASKKMKKGFGR